MKFPLRQFPHLASLPLSVNPDIEPRLVQGRVWTHTGPERATFAAKCYLEPLLAGAQQPSRIGKSEQVLARASLRVTYR